MPPSQPFVPPPSSQSNPSRVLPAVAITIVVVLIVVGLAWYTRLVSFAVPTSTPSTQSNTVGTESIPATTESMPILSEGTYALVGHGAGQSANYSGTVKITKRINTNNVYDLVWNITSGQAQLGVGILTNDVLSVSYYETTPDGYFKDIGVVSYKVLNLVALQGEWTSVAGGTAGFEELTLQPQLPGNKEIPLTKHKPPVRAVCVSSILLIHTIFVKSNDRWR